MRERRQGHIINFSSIGGLIAFPAIGCYNASKFAVKTISEALAKEVAPLGIKVTAIDPSGFRTDWAGCSVIESETVIPDYAETAGANRERLKSSSGKQDGDTAKAAEAVVKVYLAKNPPLHLLLGSDAYNMAVGHLEELSKNIEAWKDLTLSTDY